MIRATENCHASEQFPMYLQRTAKRSTWKLSKLYEITNAVYNYTSVGILLKLVTGRSSTNYI